MKTIHRYVLKEMLPSFLICLTLLTFLFMINKVFLLMDLVLNKKVPILDTLFLYVTLVPFVLSLTTPMSMMVGTLLAFGRLSSDMEVTALKSGGIHLFHLIAPVLAAGLVMTGFMLFFNDRILPAANYAFKVEQFKLLQRQANIAIRDQVFIDQFEGYHFYIDHQSQGIFSNVKVFNRFSSGAPLETTLAKTGQLVTDQKTLQLFFHLNDGVMSWDNRNFHTYNRLYFDSYIIHLKLANQLAHLADVKKDFEEMDLVELTREMASAADPGRLNYVRTEFQKRLSLPFACLALTWFCAPLGLWTRSKGFLGFVLGIIMIFLYYLMFILGMILSQRGSINPLFGLWWANGVMALLGGVLYYLVVTEQSAFRFAGKKAR